MLQFSAKMTTGSPKEERGYVHVCRMPEETLHRRRVESFMFADDVLLVGDNEQKLQKTMIKFGSVFCQVITRNVSKGNVMKTGRSNCVNLNIISNGKKDKRRCINKHSVLYSTLWRDGRMDEEVSHCGEQNRKERHEGHSRNFKWKNRYMLSEEQL